MAAVFEVWKVCEERESERETMSKTSSGQGNSTAENEAPLPSQPAEPLQQEKEKQEFVKMKRTRHTMTQSNYRSHGTAFEETLNAFQGFY